MRRTRQLPGDPDHRFNPIEGRTVIAGNPCANGVIADKPSDVSHPAHHADPRPFAFNDAVVPSSVGLHVVVRNLARLGHGFKEALMLDEKCLIRGRF